MNTPKICPQCGTRFEGRPNKLFCTDRCKLAAFHERHSQPVNPTLSGKPLNPPGAVQYLHQQQLENQERQRRLEEDLRTHQMSYEHQRSESTSALQRLETLLNLARQSKPVESIPKLLDTTLPMYTESKVLMPEKADGAETVSIVPQTVSESDDSGSGLKLLLGTVGAIWLISKL